jgi:hypothetical protein
MDRWRDRGAGSLSFLRAKMLGLPPAQMDH